jgi:hypothetical protein
MKLKQSCVLSFVALLIAARASADYCTNKDLVNLGPTAYDIAITISGNQPVTFHYDGWTGGFFNSFTVTPSGGNETLHWQNLNGNNDPIPTGGPWDPAQVHIGWCTVNPSDPLDMFWTDINGLQIAGSIVAQIGGHASGSPIPGVQWDNATNHTLAIRKIFYTIQPKRLALADLTRNNRVLATALRPVPGGDAAITIAPGKSVELKLPNAKVGDWVVIVHEVTGDRSTAGVTDFVQFRIPDPKAPVTPAPQE